MPELKDYFSIVPENVAYSSALNRSIVEELNRRYPFLVTGTNGNSVI